VSGILIVFAKAPRPGRVKTRLARALGAAAAARLHARLLERALASARQARCAEVELHCAPDCAHPLLRRVARRYRARLRAQSGGDLGERMHRAFAGALGRSAAAVLVGSDCPGLGPRALRAAFDALAGGMDAVLAPAADGGYALLGLRRAAPRLFESIAWGGPQVLEQTRARLAAAGLRWRELAQVRDVDRPADVARLRRAPRAGCLP
jgi:rSAM/selenodomain-associated transferase 1